MSERQACMSCGAIMPIDALDAKPSRFAAVSVTNEQLSEASDRGDDFDFLACERCYGPAFISVGQSSYRCEAT